MRFMFSGEGAGLIQSVKKLFKLNIEGDAWHFKAMCLEPAVLNAHPSASRLWIDNPHCLNPHCTIVGGTLLCVGVGIVRRQDFDDEERRVNQYVRWSTNREDDKIWYADS